MPSPCAFELEQGDIGLRIKADASQILHLRGRRGQAQQDGKRQDSRDQHAREQPAVAPVAAPQRRLLANAPQPLQARTLHPARRPAHAAGDEVHCSAQIDPHRHLDLLQVVQQPSLPLACADRHDEQIGSAAVDMFDRRRRAHLLHAAEPRRRKTDAAHAAGIVLEHCASPLGHALVTAEEVGLQGTVDAIADQPLEQPRPGHTLGQGRAQQSRDPHDRRAVGNAQVAAQHRFAKRRIAGAGHGEIEIRRGDEATPAGTHRLSHRLLGLRFVDRVERKTEQTEDIAAEIDRQCLASIEAGASNSAVALFLPTSSARH